MLETQRQERQLRPLLRLATLLAPLGSKDSNDGDPARIISALETGGFQEVATGTSERRVWRKLVDRGVEGCFTIELWWGSKNLGFATPAESTSGHAFPTRWCGYVFNPLCRDELPEDRQTQRELFSDAFASLFRMPFEGKEDGFAYRMA